MTYLFYLFQQTESVIEITFDFYSKIKDCYNDSLSLEEKYQFLLKHFRPSQLNQMENFQSLYQNEDIIDSPLHFMKIITTNTFTVSKIRLEVIKNFQKIYEQPNTESHNSNHTFQLPDGFVLQGDILFLIVNEETNKIIYRAQINTAFVQDDKYMRLNDQRVDLMVTSQENVFFDIIFERVQVTDENQHLNSSIGIRRIMNDLIEQVKQVQAN